MVVETPRLIAIVGRLSSAVSMRGHGWGQPTIRHNRRAAESLRSGDLRPVKCSASVEYPTHDAADPVPESTPSCQCGRYPWLAEPTDSRRSLPATPSIQRDVPEPDSVQSVSPVHFVVLRRQADSPADYFQGSSHRTEWRSSGTRDSRVVLEPQVRTLERICFKCSDTRRA